MHNKQRPDTEPTLTVGGTYNNESTTTEPYFRTESSLSHGGRGNGRWAYKCKYILLAPISALDYRENVAGIGI